MFPLKKFLHLSYALKFTCAFFINALTESQKKNFLGFFLALPTSSNHQMAPFNKTAKILFFSKQIKMLCFMSSLKEYEEIKLLEHISFSTSASVVETCTGRFFLEPDPRKVVTYSSNNKIGTKETQLITMLYHSVKCSKCSLCFPWRKPIFGIFLVNKNPKQLKKNGDLEHHGKRLCFQIYWFSYMSKLVLMEKIYRACW